MKAIDYESRIPNNVDLGGDRRLQRALEKWQPAFLDWWGDMGPEGFQGNDVYLRTAVSTDPGGWANFGHVKMPDYRWGIFLSEAERDRVIPAGDHAGKPVWQTVPGEFRNQLRRIIVTQGDTEPASVEQQRWLAKTAPSLMDMRNLFQVNVEEGRHLWAMVYLLHAHFGRDGRDEADALLERRSGDADKPRILDAFNQPCPDWLTFFCFTMFTDRDGKYQLGSLAESAFDPLSRTCRFMLIEEAHHLSVGELGLERVMRRACELMKEDPNGDVRDNGGIDLPTIQKWINHWFCYSLDLFGSEISSNAADYFSTGIKGRWREAKDYTDHSCINEVYQMDVVRDGKVTVEEVALRNAMNEVLRDDYVKDCERVVKRWNKAIAAEGVDFTMKLPSTKFFRRQGIYAEHAFDPEGNLITHSEYEANVANWLPTPEDREYVDSLMIAVTEPGKVANWIAAPKRGINKQDFGFEYVRV
ncbi:MAG: benzoyl-CoA 2,3-epoxidase subunit BoxB [Proteobacteria bacterium]|nr:benzoyl-CoA 2,3-epoxidase subunit BoxB [Pseudomonadota bacterium]MCP4919749.1 benzoyl-CoA 2,3-epoxidase subunit BoxB [Pseudomonadota bacterium]